MTWRGRVAIEAVEEGGDVEETRDEMLFRATRDEECGRAARAQLLVNSLAFGGECAERQTRGRAGGMDRCIRPDRR
jgi:hypothetical protein